MRGTHTVLLTISIMEFSQIQSNFGEREGTNMGKAPTYRRIPLNVAHPWLGNQSERTEELPRIGFLSP
jgi:hypothetical protein